MTRQECLQELRKLEERNQEQEQADGVTQRSIDQLTLLEIIKSVVADYQI